MSADKDTELSGFHISNNLVQFTEALIRLKLFPIKSELKTTYDVVILEITSNVPGNLH
jgi:hypothetical protein